MAERLAETTHAMVLPRVGGPDVFEARELPIAPPGHGEVRLYQTAIGLNFHDVYYRNGLYPLAVFPAILGVEAAGVVTALGPGVTGLAEGDRVVYGTRPMGAYVRERNLPAGRLVHLPDWLDEELAAASFIRGITACVLLHRVRTVAPGEWLLVHAAAGGAGSLLCQWASSLGARVIGTVGSEGKVATALASGCEAVLPSGDAELVARVRELTQGQGVAAVYDSVGRDTFAASLDCLAPLGMLVSFGQSSGAPPPVTTADLAVRGSLTLVRPVVFDYLADGQALQQAAQAFFAALQGGRLRLSVGHRYPLAQVAQGHRDLEGRQTWGLAVLVG